MATGVTMISEYISECLCNMGRHDSMTALADEDQAKYDLLQALILLVY